MNPSQDNIQGLAKSVWVPSHTSHLEVPQRQCIDNVQLHQSGPAVVPRFAFFIFFPFHPWPFQLHQVTSQPALEKMCLGLRMRSMLQRSRLTRHGILLKIIYSTALNCIIYTALIYSREIPSLITNIATENRPSQKESSLSTIHFQVFY